MTGSDDPLSRTSAALVYDQVDRYDMTKVLRRIEGVPGQGNETEGGVTLVLDYLGGADVLITAPSDAGDELVREAIRAAALRTGLL